MLSIVDEYWKTRYNTIGDPVLAARHRIDERLQYDVEFIKKYLKNMSTVLDLGSGPGVIANEIAPVCKEVVCVEKQDIDWNKAAAHPNITGITEDVVNFNGHRCFDVILIFGVVNHLTPKRAKTLYMNCRKMMASSSVLILKSQFALQEDFYIDTFSQELNARYQSHYRTVKSEMELAKSAFLYDVFDIYPEHINKHSNSRHFHLVCSLK